MTAGAGAVWASGLGSARESLGGRQEPPRDLEFSQREIRHSYGPKANRTRRAERLESPKEGQRPQRAVGGAALGGAQEELSEVELSAAPIALGCAAGV